ncbi:MAG: S49 family peptidase [Agarilytica sp.]
MSYEQLFNTPSLIDPSYIPMVQGKKNTESSERPEGFEFYIRIHMAAHELTDFSAIDFGHLPGQLRPYVLTDQGVAIISVHGTLLNRLGYWSSYATGYETIVMRAQAAMADPEVKALLFDMSSPGGSASGAFETARMLKSITGKPKLGVVNSRCASACYAIASSLDHIAAIPSATVGSIGVVMTHWDHSKSLKDNGVDVTMIYAGEHKTDGNPFNPLPEDVKNKYESQVRAAYEEFVALVSDYRGVDKKMVIDTEADVFSGEDALHKNLVDSIISPYEISSFVSQFLNQPDEEVNLMSETQEVENEQALSSAKAEASADTKTRIKTILGSEEAEGREDLAKHLAFDTELTGEAAIACLSASPKVEASTSQGFNLDSAMQSDPTDLGDDVPAMESAEADPLDDMFSIFDAVHTSTAAN